jgi:hypothetical protein
MLVSCSPADHQVGARHVSRLAASIACYSLLSLGRSTKAKGLGVPSVSDCQTVGCYLLWCVPEPKSADLTTTAVEQSGLNSSSEVPPQINPGG